MVDKIGLEKPKVDEIYYAILHPNLISNSYKWKTVVNQLFMAKMFECFKQGCQQEYVACQ